MNLTDRSAITIKANRQRQEFDPVAIQELITSIEVNGLMHAPVTRWEGSELILVAGERRLKALDEMALLGMRVRYDGQDIPPGKIPYVNLGDLSELEAEEAELDENLKRKDLTWQEHAAAVQRLHELRQKQAAAKPAPNILPAPTHTVADTAKELLGRSDGAYQDTIRQELIVARHLHDPAIAGAKDVKEAFKILKAQEQTKKNEELAAMVGLTFSAASHRLYNTNCLSYMADIRDQAGPRFDVICTDPPYGMDADKFGDGGGKLTGITHKYDDSHASWKPLMENFAKLSYAITKDQAHAYLFCDFDRFHELKSYMESAGWYVFRTPLVVHKLGSGRVPIPDRGPRRQWELVLYAIKGNKPVTHIYPDVIPSQADDSTGHGAQKPVAVVHNLLQRSVRPGDKVFDGFAGSGSIFPAAHQLRCEVVACELDAGSYGIALRRMQGLLLEGQSEQMLEALGAQE